MSRCSEDVSWELLIRGCLFGKLTPLEKTVSPEQRSPVDPVANKLEALPEELKVIILKDIPTIPTLRDLVFSSPSFHRAYISNRQAVLISVLSKDIPSEVLRDTLYLLKIRAAQDRTATSFPGFLNSVWESKYTGKEQLDLSMVWPTLSINDLLEIVHFHTLVHALTRKFCLASLKSHPDVSTGTSPDFGFNLSEAEKIRSHRSIYRLEILCVLSRGRSENDMVENYLTEMLKLFLFMFEYHEVEEIACIHDSFPNFIVR